MLKTTKIIRNAVFLFLMAVSTFCFSEELNKIVAKVNNSVITSKDIEEYAKSTSLNKDEPKAYKKILEHLIEEKLILQEAKKEKMKVDDNLVEKRLKQLISAYESYDEFEKSLTNQGLNITKVKEKIRDNFIIRQAIEKYVSSQISISPVEVTNYYQHHIKDFISPPKYICWIAKSNKKSFLDKLSIEIKEKGINKVLESNKDIFFKIESDESGLKEEVKEVVKNIKEKEFKVKEIEGSYYLIYLAKVVPEHKKFLSEVKEEIYKKIWEEKFSKRLSEWINKLKKNSVIKIYQQF